MRRLFIGIFAIALVGVAFGFTPQAEADSQLIVVGQGAQCLDAAFLTIQEALDDAATEDGDTIMVCPGSNAGALVDKSVEIKGMDGAVIDTGPLHPAGLTQGFRMLTGSDGATFSHLRFEVDLAIMNGDGVDGVTVSHNVFINSIQAISNWRGDNWNISQNKILDLRTFDGGGIAILIGAYWETEAQNNVVSHNDISGTLHVWANDGGGYSGTGIVLYADHRWNREGGEISGNTVVKNKVSLVSDTPNLVDVVAIELTDTRGDDISDCTDSDIQDNAVGFNDLRDTTIQLALTPTHLDNCNDISRNLGDNRGQGSHPSVLGPGGN